MPDFIIIGAMKSATSTLQEQLAAQPGIFMSTPKEPNFFSDSGQFAKGMPWYQGLFHEANGSLRGEASTHYTKLPTYPETVLRIKQHLPQVRLIYVMRHPLDRLVSHYMHEWSTGVYRCSIDQAVDKHSELVDYGRYAFQLAPFFDAFGQGRILPVFFDRLTREPQAELERICRFLGYEGDPHWVQDLKPDNVSSERIRRFPGYAILVDSALATWLRRHFVPQGMRDAVKSSLRMKERPVLAEEVKLKLVAQFDQDLAQLGTWLGVDLNCQNFKQQTAATPLNWVDAHA